MKSYQYAMLMLVLLAITFVDAHNSQKGDKSKSKKAKPGKSKDKWGKPRPHSSEDFDWPCIPFSTTDVYETEETDFYETYETDLESTWSKGKKWSKDKQKSKGKKKPKDKKKRHKKGHKRPCKTWGISSTDYDIMTTGDSSDEGSTTADSSDATEASSTIDCYSYDEGCSSASGTAPPGVCCVHEALAICVSCDQDDLCSDDTNKVCECYEVEDCPDECGSRCIGLSSSLLRNAGDTQAGDALKTEPVTGKTMMKPLHLMSVLIVICVVVLVLVIGGIHYVCSKRRRAKYSTMSTEDNVDMEVVNIAAADTAVEQVRGEESGCGDVALPESDTRTDVIKEGSEKVGLTEWVDLR